MKAVLWIVGILAVGFVLIEVIGTIMMPHTYGEIAADEKAHCIRYNGSGSWVASSGVTLEKFCEAAGALKALEAEKQDHPERF